VVPWINGSNPNAENVDLVAAAVTLGSFLRALHGIKTDPDFKGPENGRGCALEARDEITRNAIRELGNRVDKGRLEAAWQRALSAKPWPLAGVWVHGDLEPGNILADQGKIVAVIDFGMLGVGDPAVDLLPAWSLFDGTSRDHFRLATDCDDDIWERGKGWALTTALIALPYYWDRSEAIRSAALAKLEQVLA
jgi:aminoglycoside phosphotransferase (APT) family kinase protein